MSHHFIARFQGDSRAASTFSNNDPCAGQTCSDHGTCSATGAAAACACERNYHRRANDSLACIADSLCVDLDHGKMLPREMHRLAEPVVAGDTDHVTGSRFLDGGASPNLPEFRRRAIPAVSHFAGLLAGARLTDATCGYRAWRLDIMRHARFDSHAEWLHTYAFEYYLYAKVIRSRGFRWRAVPITMRYPERGRPYSKIRGARDWYAMLKPWIVARVDGKGFA